MSSDHYLAGPSAPFLIRDVLAMYEELVELVDQISPRALAALVRVHDLLEAVDVPYVAGFSVRFPDGVRFTRGWQAETIDSQWEGGSDPT